MVDGMMRFLRRLMRVPSTLEGSRLDRELDDELRAYLDERIAGLVAAGVDPAEARRLVLAREGGISSIQEQTRMTRPGFWLAATLQDLRYGLRGLRRTPAFSLVALATIALGVGASVATFTVVQSVLWRPLPYPDADRLIVVDAAWRGVADAGATGGEVAAIRERSRAFDRIGIVNGVDAHVEADGETTRVAAASVSDDVQPALGARPALGRLLEARLDGEAARGIVISDELWRRRFGADPGIVGRAIPVNNSARTVVGVLAPGFRVYLPASIGTAEQVDVWFSTGLGSDFRNRGAGVIAKLSPAVSATDAQRELDGIASQLMAEQAGAYQGGTVQFRIRDVRRAVTAGVDASLAALAIAVGFVLLVSCVNVANLMVARGAARTRELAVRRALGASRGRLLRQLLTESLLLSAIGTVLGVVCGQFALDVFAWLQPSHLPRQADIAMDRSVALFATGVAIASGLVFGALPAIRLTRADQPGPLGREESTSRGVRRLQRGLVVAEIALSIVPLLAAGLMLRSFVNLTQAPLGYDVDRVVTAWMPISFRRFPDLEARLGVQRDAMARVRALPGVESVSAVSPAPLGPLTFTRRFGRAGDDTPMSTATMQVAMPGALSVLGTRLLQGRDFTDDDLAHRRNVVIVDERIARALWPNGAVGERLATTPGSRTGGGPRPTELEVVGVTTAVRTRQVRDGDTPHFFLPYHLFPVEMAMVIRAPAEAPPADAIRRAIADANTGRAVDVRPLRELVRESVAETRFTMLVLGTFAAAAVLLAAIGLYGTLVYLASQRAREFGIRLALGANRRDILALVGREGLRLAVVGIAIGLAGALMTAQLMRHLLYGVRPFDGATIAAVAVIAAALATAACLKPAWNAAAVDPVRMLRSD